MRVERARTFRILVQAKTLRIWTWSIETLIFRSLLAKTLELSITCLRTKSIKNRRFSEWMRTNGWNLMIRSQASWLIKWITSLSLTILGTGRARCCFPDIPRRGKPLAGVALAVLYLSAATNQREKIKIRKSINWRIRTRPAAGIPTTMAAAGKVALYFEHHFKTCTKSNLYFDQ